MAALALAGALSCSAPPEPTFDEQVLAQTAVGHTLPRNFLLGVTTAAYQIEGGNTASDWWSWEPGRFPTGRPHIAEDARSGRAVDSWNRWTEDLRNLRSLGANSYRLGLEWSRLQPSGPDSWDESAAWQYHQQLEALRAAGITPMVTLYHYTLPQWVADRGGWEAPEALELFRAFALRAGRRFGDVVDLWLTVNEPTAVSVAAYGGGLWPPGVSDNGRALVVLGTLVRAHAVAARALHTGDTADADGDGRAASVGFAHNITLERPASGAWLDSVVASSGDQLANEAVLRAVLTGSFDLDIPGAPSVHFVDPSLRGSLDFLGVNYYRRDRLRGDLSNLGRPAFTVPTDDTASASDWELYPQGLYDALLRLSAFRWPIYITENGVDDAADTQRAYVLRSHLWAIEQARAAGVDVRGYFHWTLTDNFEWHLGYTAHYGLFSVDFADPALPRTMRPSGHVFQEIARNIGLR